MPVLGAFVRPVQLASRICSRFAARGLPTGCKLAQRLTECYTIILMKKLRTGLAYSVYVLVLGAVFVYSLFPAETVSRFIIARAAAVSPAVRLSIGDVSPLLPPGLRLHQVTIAHAGEGLLTASQVRLYPRWLSLAGERPRVAYTAIVGQGSIRGTATAAGSSAGRQLLLDADLNGVRLEQLPALQPLAAYGLEGLVSGSIRFAGGSRPTADLQITIDDMTVAPARPVLGIGKLRFGTVRTEATLANDRLEIARIDLEGNPISGVLSGSVAIGRRWLDSTLSLAGTLQLNLRGQTSQRGIRSSAPGAGGISLAGKVPVRIEGTLESPRVILR